MKATDKYSDGIGDLVGRKGLRREVLVPLWDTEFDLCDADSKYTENIGT